jgi:cholesterol transport system auxiliary component
MSRPSRRGPGFLLAAGAALAAAGCAGLFTDPPKKLYRITPVAAFPAGLPHVPVQLLIEVPIAPSALDSERIALSRSPLSLDYFADSQWTDRAPIVLQTALLESFENSGGIVAIDRESPELRADFVLRTEIRHFEAEYGPPDKLPRIQVTLNARLVNSATRAIVGQKSFALAVQAAGNDVPHVVQAFDEALDGAIKEVVVWTLTNPVLGQKPALPTRLP